MKKNRIYILSLVLLSMLYACKDEYEAPDFISDAQWLISQQNNVRINEGVYTLSEGDWISFADLSQGAISHTWTIDKGTSFMRTGFGKEEEDYSQYVIEGSDSVTTNTKAHVYFAEAGLKKIRLYNTFEDSVAYTTTGETIGGIFYPGDTLRSFQKDGVWVIDTTFTVDVYGGIKPALSVYQIIEDDEGNEIEQKLVAQVLEGEIFTADDAANFPLVEIGLGEKLRFVNETTYDRPDSTSWILNTGEAKPYKTEAFDAIVPFNVLGFELDSIGIMEVYRAETDDVDGADASTYIPLKIKVGPSNKPFRLDGDIYDQSDATSLIFNVTGSVGEIKENAKDAFSVIVNNDGTYGNAVTDYPVAVSKVEVSKSNPAELVLTLAEPIYNTDVVTVEFNPAADDQQIIRADTRLMDAFETQTIMPYFNELILNKETAGAEIYKQSANNLAPEADGWWANIKDNDNKNPSFKLYSRVEADEFADVRGLASIKFDANIDDYKTCRIDYSFLSQEDIAAGLYKVGFWVYVEQGAGLTEIKLQNNKGTGFFTHIFDVSESVVARNQWVLVEEVIPLTEITASASIKLRIDTKGANTGQLVYYFDDPSFIHYEPRE